MKTWQRQQLSWVVGTLLLMLAGSLLIAQQSIVRMRDQFETDARIMHRVLSQRAVQHDAILATLGLLQSAHYNDGREARMSSVYPQILAIAKRSGASAWEVAGDVPSFTKAEHTSRASAKPVLAVVDFVAGKFWLVLASEAMSHALQVDMRSMIPINEWPLAKDGILDSQSVVRVVLTLGENKWTIQPGKIQRTPWQFDFSKHLATDSQPFDVVVTRSVLWSELPWVLIAAWCLLAALFMTGLATVLRQRRTNQRTEELVRLGQVARLNSLGELAAGMAHELNQPLTAILANTQAAARLLKETPPDITTAQPAMLQAAEQARRAADILARLRRSVERTDHALVLQATSLESATQNVLYLLEPQLREQRITTKILAAQNVFVMADTTALEQVIHNLLTNAIHALQQSDMANRCIHLVISMDEKLGSLSIQDNGPGIANDVLPRIFEPFFTTQKITGNLPTSLGLGLSICESLVGSMNGNISAKNRNDGNETGAIFTVTLPLASSTSKLKA